jgi:signal transduction histidine kinase
MTSPSLLLVASEPAASRLAPALIAAGFEVRQLAPAEALPERVLEIDPRVLVLESSLGDAAALSSYWKEGAMDTHLPILLLRSDQDPPLAMPQMDEPVEEVPLAADPGEVAARARGLLRERLIRVFRKAFHDLSQPLTIALALSRKAVQLSSPANPVDATLQELDRQVERLFRLAEDLQRKRGE